MSPFDMVREFHQKVGQPDSPSPDISQHRELRLSLIGEELKELRDALEADDVIAVADGLADLMYVVIGSALQWGIPLERVFAEVHRSNMTKGDGPRRPDGKILKGPGYTPPDLRFVTAPGHVFDSEDDGLTYCSRCGVWDGAARVYCLPRSA
jgi:predicted HAD superfamily Cof-like phosphohydrolase